MDTSRENIQFVGKLDKKKKEFLFSGKQNEDQKNGIFFSLVFPTFEKIPRQLLSLVTKSVQLDQVPVLGNYVCAVCFGPLFCNN